MSAITIHTATVEQAESTLAVLVAAFEQYREVLDPPSGVFSETPDDIRQKLERGGGFVALDETRLVGIVLYEPHPDYLYLGRLAVLPEYRDQQIASRLIARVEQTALDRQLTRVRLGVRIALPGNQALFQHLGYRVISHHRHEGYTDYTYVMMEKALKSG